MPDGDSGDPPIATSARSATIGIVLQYASGVVMSAAHGIHGR